MLRSTPPVLSGHAMAERSRTPRQHVARHVDAAPPPLRTSIAREAAGCRTIAAAIENSGYTGRAHGLDCRIAARLRDRMSMADIADMPTVLPRRRASRDDRAHGRAARAYVTRHARRLPCL